MPQLPAEHNCVFIINKCHCCTSWSSEDMGFSLESEGRQGRLNDRETSRGSIAFHVTPANQLRFESDDGQHREKEPNEDLAKSSSSFSDPSSLPECGLLPWNIPKDRYPFPSSQEEHYNHDSHSGGSNASNVTLIQHNDHSRHQDHRRAIDLDEQVDDSSEGISTDRVPSLSMIGKYIDIWLYH